MSVVLISTMLFVVMYLDKSTYGLPLMSNTRPCDVTKYVPLRLFDNWVTVSPGHNVTKSVPPGSVVGVLPNPMIRCFDVSTYPVVVAPAWDMHAYIIAPILQNFCTDEQKKAWLPKMVTGEWISAIGLTEPGGGSDMKEIKTNAKVDGVDYIINGAKTFITNGHIADYVLLATKTDPSLGAKGVSMFWVDLSLPGVSRGKNLKKIGNKAQDTAELFFDDVRVPAANLVGELNQGWALLMDGLAQERLVVAVRSIVLAESAVDQTIEYTKQRKTFGQTVFDFQNTQFKLAEMTADVEAGRPFIDRCIELHAKGECSMYLAAKAKLWATELADRVLDDCLQLHGGYGYVWEFPIARAWADARVHRIYAGTNEVMKYIIAKSL